MNTERLTTAEAAEQLGISRATLARWVQSGRITHDGKAPGIRGAYLFRPAEVARVKGSGTAA